MVDHSLPTKVYVDGANAEVIRELKRRIGEYEDYHYYTSGQQEEDMWYGWRRHLEIVIPFIGEA